MIIMIKDDDDDGDTAGNASDKHMQETIETI